VLFHKGFAEEALNNYTIALTIEPNHLDTIVNLGYAKSILEKHEEAKKLFLDEEIMMNGKVGINFVGIGVFEYVCKFLTIVVIIELLVTTTIRIQFSYYYTHN
jgi:hypothetical protein